MRKVKLTGGEPLLYSTGTGGVVELVEQLSSLRRPGLDLDLSMTTNGVLLDRYAAQLRAAGLDRVTMSLTTIDPATFTTLISTAGRLLERSISGLKSARDAGLTPIKVNVPVYFSASRSLGNLRQLADLVDFAAMHGVTELRLFTLLWHRNFHDFAEYYHFFSPEMAAAIEEILTRWRTPAPAETAAELAGLGEMFAGVAYPKVEFGVDLGSMKLGFEAMKHARLHGDPGMQEGPYAIRMSADGAMRCTLNGPPDHTLINAVREGADQRELRALFRSLREDVP